MNILDTFLEQWFGDIFSPATLNLMSTVTQIFVIWIIFRLTKKYILNYTLETLYQHQRDNVKNSDRGRLKTIQSLMKNALLYTLYFFFAYWVLTVAGFPIQTLIAGAGIAGVAIGMGAQQFIADILNGFFIIFEEQFTVDEWIELANQNITGRVRSIGIRSTKIESVKGEIYFIANSKLGIIKNLSRSPRSINIDLPITDVTDYRELEKRVLKCTNELQDRYSQFIIDDPIPFGPIQVAVNTYSYRIRFTVQNGMQDKLYSQFMGYYLRYAYPKRNTEN